MAVDAKICGIRDREALAAVIDGGARWVGFVFFPRSPRALTPQQARPLSDAARGRVERVAVLVDADDALIDQVAPLVDALQLHGRETPERAAALRARTGRAVWKALSIDEPSDVDRAAAFAPHVDRLLFDAAPPKGSDRPGGNAVAFDGGLLRGLGPGKPWLLSGGLTPETLADAVARAGARAVDVSSGVESAPGVKSVDKIGAFLAAARRIE